MMFAKKTYQTLNNLKISERSLVHNIKTLQNASNKSVIPVLKANAYGHGIEQIVKILQGINLPYLAVDGYFEALKAGSASSHEILVMGGIDPVNAPNIKTRGITFVLFNPESIEAFGGLKSKVNIHLEIDTGMRRHGIKFENLDSILKLINSKPNLRLTGVMSHLADADNPDNLAYSKMQAKLFDKCIERIHGAGFKPEWIHLGQSAGLTRKLSKYANAVRPGIALYGINPLAPNDQEYSALQKTKPVLSFYSRPSAIQHLKKGDKVSYGLTFTAPHAMKIAVLPVGYYELLPRSISGNYTVRVGDRELPQVGRICMNHCMIDVGDLDVDLNTEFELISTDRSASNSIQSICDRNGLFNYEFLVKMNEATRHIIN